MASRYVSASQVLKRLAEIELDGVQFYEGLGEGTKSDWVRDFARSLAKAERRHRERFLQYAARAHDSGADGDALTSALPPEVRRALSVRILAPKDQIKGSAPYASEADALKMAIRAEEHIALLLTQLREYVQPRERRYISRVVKEEWNHKASLEKLLRKRLGAAST